MIFDTILPEKERAGLMNSWREWRIENILPDLMREQGVDMWLILNREWIEDPVFFTLIDQPRMASPGCTALFFHDAGKADGVKAYSCSPHGGLEGYEEVWESREISQFAALAKAVKKLNPGTIGLNSSRRWGYGDGLTASLRDDLENALGPEFSKRLVSAGDLCVRWLETRSPDELEFYKHACAVAHAIIDEFFGSISPGETTTEQMAWQTRDRMLQLGVRAWFHPTFSIQRSKKDTEKNTVNDGIIRRGDLVHCDVGIEYCGLCTDMQWWAYVCRDGEQDAPAGLKNALARAVEVAEIFMAQFSEGRTGQETAAAAKEKAEADGLKPTIYTHPVGVHGHGAGTTFNTVAPERQDERNILRWDYPLYDNTCYAIELSCSSIVPEWDNLEINLGIEETAVFRAGECMYIDGHQTEFILIR